MDLSFNQADFLMHCIEVFTFGNEDSSFIDTDGTILMDPEEINKLYLKIQELKFATNWVRKHGTGRCKSSLSYYHPLRVVTLIIMAIRKAIATQLSKAAKALEKDQTKEQAGRLINGIRIGLANVIMPNIPLSK